MNLTTQIKILINRILRNIPTFYRRVILIILDLAIIIGSFLLSTWIIFNENFHNNLITYKWLIPFFIIVAIPTYILTNQYKGITRYIGSFELYFIALRNLLIFFLIANIGNLIDLELPNKSFWLAWWILLICLSGSFRFIIRDVLINIFLSKKNRKAQVAIYGAGAAGAQLAASLRLAGNHKIHTFIDDNSELWNRSLNGIRINSPDKLKYFKNNLDQVLLAIPSLNIDRRREIIQSLQKEELSMRNVSRKRTIYE